MSNENVAGRTGHYHPKTETDPRHADKSESENKKALRQKQRRGEIKKRSGCQRKCPTAKPYSVLGW